MKLTLGLSTLLVGSMLLFSGCSYSMLVADNTSGIEDKTKYDGFDKWFTNVKHKISGDKSYKKIDFRDDKDANIQWFMTQLFKVWNKNTSNETFLQEGLAKYPHNEEAFKYFLNELPN